MQYSHCWTYWYVLTLTFLQMVLVWFHSYFPDCHFLLLLVIFKLCLVLNCVYNQFFACLFVSGDGTTECEDQFLQATAQRVLTKPLKILV